MPLAGQQRGAVTGEVVAEQAPHVLDEPSQRPVRPVDQRDHPLSRPRPAGIFAVTDMELPEAVVASLVARAGLGLGDVEGVGDALVGGVSLAVDAVGVDLEQAGDAVPGRRATSVAGTRELSQSETAAYRRSYGRRPSGDVYRAGVSCCLRALVVRRLGLAASAMGGSRLRSVPAYGLWSRAMAVQESLAARRRCWRSRS